MKKTFITPKAEVKAMEVESLLAQGSTAGVNTTPVGGSEGSNYHPDAKVGGMGTLGRTATWNAGKLDF